MEITLIGFIFIPLGIIFLLLMPRWLYGLMVFFIPFSATAVMNIEVSGRTSGFPVWMFFGTLWMISFILNTLKTFSIRLGGINNNGTILLLLFVVVAIISLIMPISLSGSLYIESTLLSESLPLEFRLKHITQILYLILGALIAILIARENSNEHEITKSIKIYVISAIFVSLWGFLQFACYKIGIPYPTIFNNSATESARGYLQEFVDINVKRISSVTVEPSIFAKYLLTVIPFVLIAVVRHQTIFGSIRDKISLLIFFLILFLSTSASGYIGLFFLILLTGFVLGMTGLLRISYMVYGIGIQIILLIVLFNVLGFNDVFKIVLLEKLTTYSALERARSVEIAWNYFLLYPILGIGWGSITSHDLVVKLLSNTGLLGFLTFSFFILYLLRQNFYCFIKYKYEQANILFLWSTATFVSLSTEIAISVVTGFDFVFGHFWFIIGMSMAITTVVKRMKKRTNLTI
ncbi:MAG: hypothetical protein NC926_07510 [Candidatus Omnitrophica bacterium]|nr:hypothetical protein [Candidatus Omnitrophota bacterium]